MSPILVRPIREQLEHDRVIRLLQAKYKRKFDVAMNPGKEQTASVAVGASPWYPDLVLQSADGRRKLLGTVEVETAESVNYLEAMSQWGTFVRLRAPFHLYVPVSSVDTAKRLCADLQISAAEIWAYNSLGDQILFTLVHRSAVRKRHAAAPARAATKAKRPVSSSRKPSGRKAAGKSRKTTAKKPVARAAGVARAARAAKAAKLKKAAKSTKSIKSAKAVRAAKSKKTARSTRAARTTKKKASRSSGPKKRK